MTILTEIYRDPIFFGSSLGLVNRTQSDPGFVNPVRSGPGFCQSDPIRSGPGFVNARKLSRCHSFRIDYFDENKELNKYTPHA